MRGMGSPAPQGEWGLRATDCLVAMGASAVSAEGQVGGGCVDGCLPNRPVLAAA